MEKFITVALIALLTACGQSNSNNNTVQQAEFYTMKSCIAGIEKNAGSQLQIVRDNPDLVSGVLSGNRHFACERIDSGSKGVYYKGWYSTK